MKKLALFSMLFCLCLLLAPSRAQAVIIFKPDVMMSDVTRAIGKVQEYVQDVMDKVKNLTLIQQIGEGYKETRDFIKKAQSLVLAYKSAYEYVKRNLVDNKLAKIKQINDDIAAVKSNFESLNYNIASVTNDITSQINAESAVIEGELNTFIYNRSMYESAIAQTTNAEEIAEYKKQIEQINKQEAEYKSSLMSLQHEKDALIKSALKPLQRKRKDIERDLEKLYMDLAILLEIGDDVNAEKAMQRNVDLYFIEPGENVTPSLMEEIRINRYLERRASIMNAYQISVNVIPDMYIYIEDGEDMGYNASTFDTIGGAAGAMAEMKIKNLRALKCYADLLVADLKMKTAIAISGLTFYKLEQPREDITTFNLDDYIYGRL